MSLEEYRKKQARFDRLAVEFWKEYREAVKPIEERYGMRRSVSGYECEDDIESTGPGEWFCRSVYWIEQVIDNES